MVERTKARIFLLSMWTKGSAVPIPPSLQYFLVELEMEKITKALSTAKALSIKKALRRRSPGRVTWTWTQTQKKGEDGAILARIRWISVIDFSDKFCCCNDC